MSKRMVYASVIVFLVSALLGSYAFALWVGPYFFSTIQAQAYQLRVLMGTASVLQYGTVLSIDASNSTMMIQAPNPFEGGKLSQLKIRIDPSAYIAKQELQYDLSGAYSSITPTVVSPLSDIHTGDHVAAMLDRHADNTLSTTYLLFGNPL